MKLKLDERTLNAYINKAINEELTELYRQEELATQPADSNGQGQTGNLDIRKVLGNKNDIARFQTWFNRPPEEGGMGGKLVVDGIIGPRTTEAWNKWLAQRDL